MEEEYCAICGQALTWKHDHRADLSGLDDGPELYRTRKPGRAYSKDEWKGIRARAWTTRRERYGPSGHR